MITIYGATGYTGRLVAELLVSRGVELTIAGRNKARLEALKGALARIARLGATPQIAPVALDDRDALRRLLERTKVILTCAGPYTEIGAPILAACLETGTHYLDITGEVRFMIETKALDEAARKKQIALVNAVGADVVPSDFVASLAAEMLGGEADSVDMVMLAEHAKASGGTLRSLLAVLGDAGLAYRDGSYVEEPIGADVRRFEWPGDLEDRFSDRTAYSAPLADLATIPRTTRAKSARTYVVLPPVAGAGAKLLSPIARALLRGKATRSIVERGLSGSGTGPSPAERKKSRFAFLADAKRGTLRALASIICADAYGLTAHTASHALVSLCNPAYARYGALTPMQAIDPGIWRQLLEKLGCKIASVRLERGERRSS